MGMSASQARLLSITSRLTNNEFRAQTITNSKLRLAEKSQAASAEYMDALNSQKLMYGVFNDNGDRTYTALTAAALLSAGDLKNQYSLINSAGQILTTGLNIKNYEAAPNMIQYMINSGVETSQDALIAAYGDNYDRIFEKDNAYQFMLENGTGEFLDYINYFRNDIATMDLNDESDYYKKIGDFRTLVKEAEIPPTAGGALGKLNDALASLVGGTLTDGTTVNQIPYAEPVSVENVLRPCCLTDTGYLAYKADPINYNYKDVAIDASRVENPAEPGANNVRHIEHVLSQFVWSDVFDLDPGTGVGSVYEQFEIDGQDLALRHWVMPITKELSVGASFNLNRSSTDYDGATITYKTKDGSIVSQTGLKTFAFGTDKDIYLDCDIIVGETYSGENKNGTKVFKLNGFEYESGQVIPAGTKIPAGTVFSQGTYFANAQRDRKGNIIIDENTGRPVSVTRISSVPKSYSKCEYNETTEQMEYTDQTNASIWILPSGSLSLSSGGSFNSNVFVDTKILGKYSSYQEARDPKDVMGSVLAKNPDLQERLMDLYYYTVINMAENGYMSTEYSSGQKGIFFGGTTPSNEIPYYRLYEYLNEVNYSTEIKTNSDGSQTTVKHSLNTAKKSDGTYENAKEGAIAEFIDSHQKTPTEIQQMFFELMDEITLAHPEFQNLYNARIEFEQKFALAIADIEQALDEFETAITNIPDSQDFKYQWYKNEWYHMGATSEITKGTNNYKELDPNLLNNSEWLQFCFEHGILTLEKAEFVQDGSIKYPRMGTYDWVSTIYTNSTDFIMQDDEVAIAIAETKYKNAVTEIENKDKKFDQDLKKLDTEHTALQTEYESVKEVMSKNVDRSFKAFS